MKRSLAVRITPSAVRDLGDVRDYLAEHAPDQVESYRETFAAIFQSLARYPRTGRPRADLRRPDIRSIVVRPYLIFYRVGAGSVEVLRVVHGARELSGLRFPGA